MIIIQLDSEQLSGVIQSSVRKVLEESDHLRIPPIKNPEEIFLGPPAARFLGIKLNTLYRKVSSREVPYMKRNGRLYFSRTELVDYLKAGRFKTKAEIEAEAHAYLTNKKVKKGHFI